MAGEHALCQILVLVLFHGKDHIHAGLICCQNICRCHNAHIRGNNRLCCNAFAVTGNRHVAHHIHKCNVVNKMVNNRLCRLGDPLHQLLSSNAPHIIRTFYRVDHRLADSSVCTANTNVLVGTAEAAHHMTLKMSQDKQGIIV